MFLYKYYMLNSVFYLLIFEINLDKFEINCIFCSSDKYICLRIRFICCCVSKIIECFGDIPCAVACVANTDGTSCRYSKDKIRWRFFVCHLIYIITDAVLDVKKHSLFLYLFIKIILSHLRNLI